jgi:cobalamin biosynthesis protein CobT
MDEEIVQQILDELFSSLERLDTQSSALLQFLKAKGIAADEDLVPFMEQAGNASNVRWRAARVRIGSLISSAMRSVDQNRETHAPVDEKNSEAAAKTSKETGQKETGQEDKSEPAARAAQAGEDNSNSGEAAAAMPQKEQKESMTNQQEQPSPPATQENVKRGAA